MARRGQRALQAGDPAIAVTFALQARTIEASSPLAMDLIASIRAHIDDALPYVDAAAWVKAIDSIEGWLTPGEATLLARCVAAAPAELARRAVEIGSYKGRSTLLLALAIRGLGSPLRLTAIDPHTGYHFGGGRDTHCALQDTLERHGVASVVDVVRARSVEVPLREPLALAFLDGLHDRDSVRADGDHVVAQLVPGGIVVFHDYRELFPGVVEVVNDFIRQDGYELAGWCDSLIALRRPAR
jgi:predicted O-methyltransferase YrrM